MDALAVILEAPERLTVRPLALNPMGPGEVVDAVAAMAKATRQTPTILNLDENDAISARFPAFESVDIPEGAFKARPATPSSAVGNSSAIGSAGWPVMRAAMASAASR